LKEEVDFNVDSHLSFQREVHVHIAHPAQLALLAGGDRNQVRAFCFGVRGQLHQLLSRPALAEQDQDVLMEEGRIMACLTPSFFRFFPKLEKLQEVVRKCLQASGKPVSRQLA
jgi:hypothetical protein